MVVEKFGVVAIPVTSDWRVLVVSDKQGENGVKNKKERLGWDLTSERVVIAGLMQFPGGVKDIDDPRGELAREIKEEIGQIVDSSQLVEMGVGTLIDHERDGLSDLYGVSIYLWLISPEVEEILRANGALEMSIDVENARPRDKIVYQLFEECQLSIGSQSVKMEALEYV